MIAGERVVALITARGGSKRLPGKNIRPLGGRPLIAWTVAAARAAAAVDRVVLSTDDAEIARAAECEAPFQRPAELASDGASSASVALHALDHLGEHFDWLVLLQPTSPLRAAADIDGCLELAIRTGAPSVVSVTEADKPFHYQFDLTEDGRLRPIGGGSVADATRRPAMGKAFRPHVLNGAVYAVRAEHFRRTGRLFDDDSVAYVMPRERSVDIDTELDFLFAETLLVWKASAHRSADPGEGHD